MQRIALPIYAILFILTTLLLSSCGAKTYAQMLEEEENSRQDFIKRESINVITDFPADTIFKNNDYYKFSSIYTNLHIQVVNRGNLQKKAKKGCEVTLRFIERDMAGNVVRDYIHFAGNPITFTYLTTGSSSDVYLYNFYCSAFDVALDYVGEGGVVKMIVPSKLGMKDPQQKVLSYHYEVEFKKIFVFSGN